MEAHERGRTNFTPPQLPRLKRGAGADSPAPMPAIDSLISAASSGYCRVANSHPTPPRRNARWTSWFLPSRWQV